MAETRFRRGVESPAEYARRKELVAGAGRATAAQKRQQEEEAERQAYEKETGRSSRGIANAGRFEAWRQKRKKNRGVTARDAGDALAESK